MSQSSIYRLVAIGFCLMWLGLLLPFAQYPISDLYQEMSGLLAIGVLALGFLMSPRAPLNLKTELIDRKKLSLSLLQLNLRAFVPLTIALLALAITVQIVLGKVVYFQLGLQVLSCLLVAYIAYQIGETIGTRSDASDIWRKSAYVLIAISFAVTCQGLIQFFQVDVYSEYIFPIAQGVRTYGNVRQANYMALFICFGMWCITSCSKPSRAISWILSCICLTIMAFVTVTTVSRASFGLLLVMLCAAFLHPAAHREQKYLTVFATSMTLIFWILMPVINTFLDFPDSGTKRIGTSMSEEVRGLLFLNSWDMSLAKPFFGHGLGNYNYVFTNADIFPKVSIGALTHAHNLTLQLAMEFGWIIAVMVTIGAACWLVRAWLKIRHTESLVMLGLVGMIALSSQIEKPLWQLYFLWPTCLWMGWIAADASKMEGTSTSDLDNLIQDDSVVTTRMHLRVDFAIASVLCIGASLGIMLSYAKLDGVYSGAGDNDLLYERVVAGNKSWFFEPQLAISRSLAATAHLREADLVPALLELEHAGKYFMNAAFLLRYSIVAALAGYPKHAEYLVWHTRLCCVDLKTPLREIAVASGKPELAALADYAANPTRRVWPGSIREIVLAKSASSTPIVNPIKK
jgi:Virulence factor membrane-bound polymerase, C-terminal/O-Antigen ligase